MCSATSSSSPIKAWAWIKRGASDNSGGIESRKRGKILTYYVHTTVRFTVVGQYINLKNVVGREGIPYMKFSRRKGWKITGGRLLWRGRGRCVPGVLDHQFRPPPRINNTPGGMISIRALLAPPPTFSSSSFIASLFSGKKTELPSPPIAERIRFLLLSQPPPPQPFDRAPLLREREGGARRTRREKWKGGRELPFPRGPFDK